MNQHVKLSASEWLQSQNISLRNKSDGDHKTTCPQCSHTRRNKTDTCLSVTIHGHDDVVVHCHHCEWSGGNMTRDNSNRTYRPVNYKKPKPEKHPEKPDTLFAWFEKRGLSKATIEGAGIYKTTQWFGQTRKNEECIAFPYFWDGQLRNVKYRTSAKHFRQEKNPQPVLYNADSIQEGRI